MYTRTDYSFIIDKVLEKLQLSIVKFHKEQLLSHIERINEIVWFVNGENDNKGLRSTQVIIAIIYYWLKEQGYIE